MYTINNAQVNGMYAFYTPTSSSTLPTITSGSIVDIVQNVVSAGGGVIRIRNISDTGNGFMGNTALNNIDYAGGLIFSAGVVIKGVGLANLQPVVSGYNYTAHTADASYSSDTLFSYAAVTSNGTVPANGTVTLICEVSN